MTQATGYVAQTSLEEGLRLTYEWYRDHVFASPALVRS